MLCKVLSCRDCGWRTVSGRDDLVTRLRLVGQLRRDKEPDDAIIDALIAGSVGRMTCPSCKGIGLHATDGDQQPSQEDGDWQAAALCEICRKTIDEERLEALPGTLRCATCQGQAEAGTLPDDDPEFCPKCGALVELRVSRGSGITRYKRFCTGVPACRL
ncbi:MAG: TraR/DksA C4-type zinc finger protein [Aeoliella sp.]